MRTSVTCNASERRRIAAKRRRVQELRCHVIIFVLSVFLFTVLLSMMFSVKSNASDNNTEHMYKHFTSVEVKAGDTLLSISKENLSGDYSCTDLMNEIIYINNLNEDSVLRSGNFIVIPYYDTFKG